MMPNIMREPVLTVDETRIGSLDPQNPVDLSMLWQAFSKTSHVIEQGERLKNFSWRLWNRETLCGARQGRKQPQLPHSMDALSIPATVPELSSSIDSSSSTETQDEVSDSSDGAFGQPIPPTNLSKERHITPNDLRNLVHSIKQPRHFKPRPSALPKPQPKHSTTHTLDTTPNLHATCTPAHTATESSTSTVATATDSFASTSKKSDTSVSSRGSTHSIVRGFTPGTNGITSYRSNYQLEPQPQPILKKSLPSMPAVSKKKGNGMFMLGCSSGSGASAEEEDLLKERMTSHPTSSSTGSQPVGTGSKKQTSFKEEISVMKAANPQHQDEAVFESDEEDSEDDSSDEDEEDDDDDDEDEVSESAIEDDDDAWEDEGSDAHEPEQEKEMKFYRVDSKANLPSHRSLLTLNLADQRNGSRRGVISTPAFRRSRTATPNGPSMPGSLEEDVQLEQRIQQIQSKPIIMNTSHVQQPPPLTSPRTTRRNMMAGELSESLRKNMLSERQQKNPLKIDSSQMRRAHTSQDVSRLTKLPEHAEVHNSYDQPALKHHDAKQVAWNHFFDHSIGEFNQAGW